MSKDKNTIYGKPWDVVSTHSTYEEATQRKESLIENKDLQVRVRRRADGTFTVKSRSSAVDPPKEKKLKSSGKPKRFPN